MKLSIVVPVYNTETYLDKCLNSLLTQGDADYEIIAVNDGSTDASGTVLEQWQARYPERIRILTTPNGGLGHARNTGLEAANGEFVVFVDSDDWLTTGAVGEMLSLIQSENADVVVFDFVQVNEKEEQLAYCRGCERNAAFTLAENPEFLFAPHNAVNKIWRRSLFVETGIRFPDRLWFEDLATTPKLFLHAKRILPWHQPWYCYLQHSGSIMFDASKALRNREMMTVADEILRYYKAQQKFEQYAPQLEYKFFYEEYLASVTRVNQIDPKSPVQAELRDDYLRLFPDYRKNRYVRSASLRIKLLDTMIRRGNWNAVRMMIALNKKRKGR